MLVLEYVKVLIWPVVVVVVAITFRTRIAALLARLTKVEALGAKAEFERAVMQAGAEVATEAPTLQELRWVEATNYSDARVIGDTYRERGAVAVNLEALGDDEAKRIVDFMAGLIFHARGAIERLASKRFLLTG